MRTRTFILALIFLFLFSAAYSWRSGAADPVTPGTHLNVPSGQPIDSDEFFQRAVQGQAL